MKRPRLTILTDYRTWVNGRLADLLAAYLAEDYNVTLTTWGEVGESKLTTDILFCLWWHALARLNVKAQVVITRVPELSTAAPHSEFGAAFAAAMRKTHLLLVPTEYHAKTLRQFYPNEVLPPHEVCEIGVDAQLFAEQPMDSEFVVGWAGSTYSKQLYGQPDNKGLELILEACRRAAVPLLIADPATQPLDWHRMPEDFYRRISVYVCASAHEGGPNTLLEAMACARPVISTPVGLAPVLLNRHTGAGQLISRSVEHLTEAIQNYKRLPSAQLAAIGRTGRFFVLNGYTWEAQLPRWKQAIERAQRSRRVS